MLASMPFPNLVLCGAIQARWSHDISKTGQMEECLGMLVLSLVTHVGHMAVLAPMLFPSPLL